MVLGDVDRLHVRIEHRRGTTSPTSSGPPRPSPPSRAPPWCGFRSPSSGVELPTVIPKQSLHRLKLRTRRCGVLQVVYALPDDRPVDVYVGEQMDVYLKAATIPKDLSRVGFRWIAAV